MNSFALRDTACMYGRSLVRPSLRYAGVGSRLGRREMAETSQSQPAERPAVTEVNLPKLSMADLRAYNSMADHMEIFVRSRSERSLDNVQCLLSDQQHSNFRQSWKTLYAACSSGRRPSNISLRQFLTMGLQFCHHLEMHHSIEENHIFPILSKKMPEFRKELELLTQHRKIHAGLDKFETYLEECRSGEKELRLEEMKFLMDTFGGVLWAHLEDEVRALGAENMRKYWTLEEMRRMPM